MNHAEWNDIRDEAGEASAWKINSEGDDRGRKPDASAEQASAKRQDARSQAAPPNSLRSLVCPRFGQLSTVNQSVCCLGPCLMIQS